MQSGFSRWRLLRCFQGIFSFSNDFDIGTEELIAKLKMANHLHQQDRVDALFFDEPCAAIDHKAGKNVKKKSTNKNLIFNPEQLEDLHKEDGLCNANS